MKGWIAIIIFFSSLPAWGQSERKFIREGNREYKKADFSGAEISYRKALSKNQKSFEASFNIGNALYKEGKYADAANQFGSITEDTKDKDLLGKVYHNLGNSYLKEKKLEKSIDAYKNALLNTPEDRDTKYNLSYALELLKKQKNQQKQNKNQKNKDKNQNKNQDKDKDKNKNQQNKNQNKQNQDKNKQEQQKNQQNQSKQLSRQDAQRMLDAVQNDENQVQKKLEEKKAQGKKVKVLENW